MPIDPVLLLSAEISALEKQVHAACKGSYERARMEGVNLMVARLRALYDELLEIAPTSAPGAGELIRIAADRLPFAQGRYAGHLYRIAERLAAGKRHAADLIWLRALTEALEEEPEAGKSAGNRTTRLLIQAVKGMARPVVVWRTALPARAPALDLHALSAGPGETMPAPPAQPVTF